MATGIPEQAHQKLSGRLHRNFGRSKGFGRGILNMLGGALIALDFFSDNPNSVGMMFETRKENKLYFDNESKNYFEITSKSINKDDEGMVII